MFSEAKAEAKRRVEDGKKISTKQQVCVCGVCETAETDVCSPPVPTRWCSALAHLMGVSAPPSLPRPPPHSDR